MPLRWTKGSPAEFMALGSDIEKQLYRSLAVAMYAIVAAAAQRAADATDRVDTGTMVGMINNHEVELTGKQVIGRFGFLGVKADYFLYQTVTGFTHYLSGDFIEPTFALRDSKIAAEAEVIAAIEAAIRSVKL